MKLTTLIGLLLFSVLIMSNSECESDKGGTPPKVVSDTANKKTIIHSDNTFAKTEFTNYTSYGKNVVYFNAVNGQFGYNLQQWIDNNPNRVITAIGYDASTGESNYPIGYFVIHYPDTAFTFFHIKQ